MDQTNMKGGDYFSVKLLFPLSTCFTCLFSFHVSTRVLEDRNTRQASAGTRGGLYGPSAMRSLPPNVVEVGTLVDFECEETPHCWACSSHTDVKLGDDTHLNHLLQRRM